MTAASVSDRNEEFSKLVVVLAGPTGSGKSDVAALLSSSMGGKAWIVSADSVQSYRHVQIGANKPSKSEQEQTPHLLIDMVDPEDNNYNAAEWRRDALWAIEKLVLHRNATVNIDDNDDNKTLNSAELERRVAIEQRIQQTRHDKGFSEEQPIVPVVVGGTMMYLQWLVDGRPDAARPTPTAAAQAKESIEAFQEQITISSSMSLEDVEQIVWKEAAKYVSSFGQAFADRVATLSGNDWYRLRRILEIALTIHEQQQRQQQESGPDQGVSPLSFKDFDDQVFTGIRQGGLESFGWDVRCFFLCPDDRMRHTEVLDRRCEDMIVRGLIQETADLLVTGRMPIMASRAIGYRQTLEYLQRENAQMQDQAALESYIDEFTTATRRYAKKQMQWFRRDKNFVFVPVAVLTEHKEERVLAAANQVLDMIRMPRHEFDQEFFSKDSSISQQTRQTNEKQGKGMKTYQFRRYRLKPQTPLYSKIFQQADECTRRVQQECQKRVVVLGGQSMD